MHTPASASPPRLPEQDIVATSGTAFPRLSHPVIAIGNFDGVHRGHQAVLAAGVALGRKLSRPVAALTFEPHPRTFFAPAKPMFRLTPAVLKPSILQAFGAEETISFDFNADFASISAGSFIDDILIGRFGAAGVIVGHDFHFGRKREGSPEFLTRHAERIGLPVSIVEPVGDDAPVSSSAIRHALEDGEVKRANGLLGYRWLVRSSIIHGDARGRALGYPTANMKLDAHCRLRYGIYAVRVRVDGAVHAGVASFGSRPTFDDGAPLLEVHLFDFQGDLYGKTPAVEFIDWIRPELKFSSIEDLVIRMDEDSKTARAMIAAADADTAASDNALSLLG